MCVKYKYIQLCFFFFLQSLLKQDKLEALKHFKKSEHERFYNELQNRVNKVFIDQFKDARKVIPLFKVIQIVFIFTKLLLITKLCFSLSLMHYYLTDVKMNL